MSISNIDKQVISCELGLMSDDLGMKRKCERSWFDIRHSTWDIGHSAKCVLAFYCLLLFSCSPSSPPEGQWLAKVPYQTITYCMVVENKASRLRLVHVTFKGYEVPMDTIYFNGDSLHLRFQEFYTAFDGRYDPASNSISGKWIKEDSVQIPVTFEAVNADTVKGMHPRTTKDYNYHPPRQENDQWSVSSTADQSINQSIIDSLTQGIMKERFPDVHSLLIARNNALVYEEYFYTFHSAFRQNIQSVTKSFVSALAGIAIAKGELTSVDESLCGHLPDYRELVCNEQNKSVTFHQLLSMTTGLEWDEATYEYGDPRNSAAIANSQDNPFTYLFTRPRSSKPSFAYNSMNHSTMNAVLKSVTHLDNGAEMTTRLLSPLGIDSVNLGEPEHGVLGDIELRPRDMMKLGQLYLQEGIWNGKEIVPRKWILESTSSKVAVGPRLGYGYFWWTRDFQLGNKVVRSFFAWGYGGQYIFVVPELHLVVAMTGSHWTTNPEGHAMEMMEKYIIPACL